jgi:hypothetical protein
MDRSSRILLYIFLFLCIATVMFSFARYMIFHDFEVVETPGEEVETEPASDMTQEAGTE